MLLNRKSHRLISLVVSTVFLLTACTPGGPTVTQPVATQPISPTVAQNTPETAPTETSAPSGPKSVTILYTRSFDNLNPLYTSILVNDKWFSAITLQIWNAWAWDFDESNNPHPVLVKEIPSLENGGISPDGKTITLHLRDDIVWSDGQPITSADFRFTFQMAVDPNNHVLSSLPYNLISSMDTPDDRTVVINFAQPYIPWLGNLWHGLLPEHILQPVYNSAGTLDSAEWNRAPTVGCGPFVFAEWKEGEFVRFTANERYWLGRPKIDELIIRFVSDDEAQLAALSAGEADLGARVSYSDIADLQNAGLGIQKVNSGSNEGWFFMLHPFEGHPALQDVRVRQAIAMALDRDAIVRDLLFGQTVPAISYWDNTPYIDPDLKPYPYDPEKAKQLLDDAGWIDANGDGIREKDGVSLILSYGTTAKPLRLDVQTFAIGQLAQVGIKLEPISYDTTTFFQDYGLGGPIATGQVDIFEYAPSTTPGDPDTTDFRCSEIPSDEVPNGANWSYFCDQELDQLFQLELTQIDFNQRQETFHKISRIIYDKVYFLGLWQELDLWALKSRLTNVRLSAHTPFYNIVEWDIAQ